MNGKTQLAAELIRARTQAGDPQHWAASLYVRAMEVFLRIRRGYTGDEDELSIIRRFIEPGLLVIDEAHDRGETDWENRLMNLIVDTRYGALRDTVFIANQTESAFEESVGPSIYRRLVETGGVIDTTHWPKRNSRDVEA